MASSKLGQARSGRPKTWIKNLARKAILAPLGKMQKILSKKGRPSRPILAGGGGPKPPCGEGGGTTHPTTLWEADQRLNLELGWEVPIKHPQWNPQAQGLDRNTYPNAKIDNHFKHTPTLLVILKKINKKTTQVASKWKSTPPPVGGASAGW